MLNFLTEEGLTAQLLNLLQEKRPEEYRKLPKGVEAKMKWARPKVQETLKEIGRRTDLALKKNKNPSRERAIREAIAKTTAQEYLDPDG